MTSERMGLPAVDTEPTAVGLGAQPEYAIAELADVTERKDWAISLGLLIGRFAIFAGAIALWEYLAVSRDLDFWIGRPTEVVERLVEWTSDGFLWIHIGTTLQAMVYGLLLGAITGIGLGILLGLVQVIGRLIDPFIMAIYAMPKIALAPMFVLWFGIGMEMRTILVGTICFFLVFINTYAGVRDRDIELIQVMQVMGASQKHIILKLVLPGSLSYIVTGLKLAIPMSLTGAVFAEIIASNRGIGYLLMRSAGQFDTSGLFAALAVLMVLAIILNAALNFGSDRFLRWKVAGSG